MSGYATPATIPVSCVKRVFLIPSDPDLIAAFNAALLTLGDAANWSQCADITPEETAQMCMNIILEAMATEEHVNGK